MATPLAMTPRQQARSDRARDRVLEIENRALRARLAHLEETLRAIRGSEVDALYVTGLDGDRLFTLDGADRAYRALIEEMGQGALTLTPGGVVAYANRHFAELLGRPLSEVIGAPVGRCFAPEAQTTLADLLLDEHPVKRSAELDLLSEVGLRVPTMLSVCRIDVEGLPGALCMTVTDLTGQKRGEAAVRARQTLMDVIEAQHKTQELLEASLNTLRLHDSALGAISQGVLISDAQRRTTYVNAAFELMTGYSAADMVGRSCNVLQGSGTDPEALQTLLHALDANLPFHGELLNYRKDGTPFWNALSVTPIFDDTGVLTQFVGVQRDVSARRQAEAQLLLAAQVFEHSEEGFIVIDAAHNIVKVNQAFSAISGFSEAEVLGRDQRMLSADCGDLALSREMWDEVERCGSWHGEVVNRRKDGSLYPQELSMSRVVDASGKAAHYIASFNDITRRKAAEDRIQRLAHYDPLTNLPNRVLLNERAGHALQLALRSNEPMAVLFMDLDHFKNVNDSLGHRIGDLLLVALAGRFHGVLREQDTLSRVGGDEFVLILPATGVDGAAHVAQKLLHATLEPLQIEQHELAITPSIGIALYPLDGVDFDTLAKCADAAMYRAKQDGRNTFRFFTAELQAQTTRVLLVENALRRALERGQMQLHYQPQRLLADGKIVGAEALLRWEHPELGWVSPAEFIPIAESSGLITSIGEWVLRTAVNQLRTWFDHGMPPMTVAVNLSAVQFRQLHLPELVSRILDDAGVSPSCLELELTESVASDDPVGAIEMMNKLHALGMRMSIDDFGTGYSSLSYLKRFKVYKLKIDQSFVRGITDDPEDQAIVTSIIGLAKSLGMTTIAEGVETEAQMAYLRANGCDEMQGYWFSRPLPADQFLGFVSDSPRTRLG
jgi:diguanylate cyclase (GGDEF)-like protein/PAS domain S-box-containing protein